MQFLTNCWKFNTFYIDTAIVEWWLFVLPSQDIQKFLILTMQSGFDAYSSDLDELIVQGLFRSIIDIADDTFIFVWGTAGEENTMATK